MNKSKKNKIQYEIIELFEKGYSLVDIKIELCEKHKLSMKSFENIYLRGLDEKLEKRGHINRKLEYGKHLGRYELIYRNNWKKFDSLGKEFDHDTYKYFLMLMKTCMRALFQKEKMMQIHTKGISILMKNNTLMIEKKEERGSANKYRPKIEELSFEEKKELHGLLLKTNLINMEGVWEVKQVPEGEEIQDVVYVEVKEKEEDDLPENVVEQMQVEVEENEEDEVKKNILTNITKEIQLKSKKQLIEMLLEKRQK